uniref:Uncharacterized protein n=1 Tax=Arundo donax TaxID=35708 RepID=A0A0A9BK13_ARUDO
MPLALSQCLVATESSTSSAIIQPATAGRFRTSRQIQRPNYNLQALPCQIFGRGEKHDIHTPNICTG